MSGAARGFFLCWRCKATFRNLAEAERLHRRALAGREARLGPDHPLTLNAVWNLAYTLRDLERFAEAAPLYGTPRAAKK